MDHREPEPAATRRFARLVPPEAVRKVTLSRLLPVAGAGLVVVALLVYGMHLGVRRASEWLHQHPANKVPFREITLSPEPPRWYRGGTRAFLEHVADNEKSGGDSVSILNTNLEALAYRFRAYPWIRAVNRVRVVYPAQIVVELEYRTPVAEKGGWLIDADGTLLPAEPVDRAAINLLLVEHLDPPYDPHPGKAWQIYDEKKHTVREEPRAAAAGRLAAFLLNAPRDGGLPPPVKAVLVGPSERKLYAQFEPVTRVAWGSAPASEAQSEPSANEKWQLLRDWFRDHPEPIARDDFLVIKGKKIVIQHEPPGGPLSRRPGGSGNSMSR